MNKNLEKVFYLSIIIDNPFDIIYENGNLNYIQIFQLNL